MCNESGSVLVAITCRVSFCEQFKKAFTCIYKRYMYTGINPLCQSYIHVHVHVRMYMEQ